MNECVFCDIIDGKIPAAKVYENELVYIMVDNMPINRGHTLILPKKHYSAFEEIDKETLFEMFSQGQNISRALYASEIKCEGINVVLNNGSAAGQEIFHSHLHLIPRYKGDGFRIKMSEEFKKQKPQNHYDVANELIKFFKSNE